MENIENTMSDSGSCPQAGKQLFTVEKLQDILLAVSIGQLILGILLYMLGSIQFWVLLVEGIAAIALTLLSHFRFDRRILRIILRILCILLAALPFVAGTIIIVSLYFSGSTLEFQANLCLALAILILTLLVFLQPVFVINAAGHRRFDIVMLRIISLATLIISLIFILYVLEFQVDNGQLIVTSVSYSPVIFDHQENITIAIDSIFTRVLFCMCSAIMVICSFLVHSVKTESKEDKKSKSTNL